MNFETEKVWMIRRDGEAFACEEPIYGSEDNINETLRAAQWLYQHTAQKDTKELILRFFRTYGSSLNPNRNCVRSILLDIKAKQYAFLDYNFIMSISGAIQNAPAGNLSELNHEVNHALNNEFMRVRYDGFTDPDDGDECLYLRVSSDDRHSRDVWEPITSDIIAQYDEYIHEAVIFDDENIFDDCHTIVHYINHDEEEDEDGGCYVDANVPF